MLTNLNTVVAGHLCLDIIPNLEDLPTGEFLHLFQPGRLINVGSAIFSTGGPVSNTGLALHILGISTRLMGKVGNDAFGQAVQDLVGRYGQELISGMIIDKNASTSYTVIINPPGIDRIFLHHTGANDTFGPEDIRLDDLNEAALFHFGYPPLMRRMYDGSGEDLTEIFRLAKSTGVTTSLDMSLPDPASKSGKAPWQQILANVLPYVDIFTPSIEELLFTLYPEKYGQLCVEAGSGNILPLITPTFLNEISSELLAYGVKIALIKIGDRGAYLRTGDQKNIEKMGRASPSESEHWSNFEAWAPCFKVNVVGTTGSGDSTIAGFLSGLLRSMSPEDALTAAVAVGACNCEAADAIGGLLSWEKTMDRIQKGWLRRPLEIISNGWHWNSQKKIWLSPSGYV